MKKAWRKRTAAAVCSMVLCTGAAFSAYGTSADIQDAKKKVSALEEEKKKVESTINELEGLKSDTAAYVKQLDGSLAQLASELTKLEGQIGDKEDEIATAQEELEAAKAAEEEQYDSMKLRIKYMYENGDTGFMEAIAQSQSIAELLNRAEYVSQVAEYDRKMLVKYGETKDAVALKEQELQSEREALVELQESTEAKEASVQKLMDQKQAELTSYNEKIRSAQGDLSEFDAQIKAQEAEVAKIEAEMKRREEEARKREEEAKKKAEAEGKTYTTTNLGNISFIWPCPSSSRITSTFGDRESPTEGASSNHKAIDIGASTGANILAAADGEVTISTYSVSAGNYIMLDHGGGVSTVYMHCSQLLVSKGEKVKKGQVIAKVGSTGYSTGPHLHFGVRSGGTYVDPLKYVSP
ncbi:MAG: peptidoglycan DD-metalloendopeptidase family protein [Clostridiales bacterium]|nr:peptidoglycan DD-metalloendopeptidase family protein [Clostridiales bacterium]